MKRTCGAVLVLVLLGGCTPAWGDDDDEAVVEMIEGEQFLPAGLVVEAGTRVVWHNQSSKPHTTTTEAVVDGALAEVPDGAPRWDSGAVHPGEVVTLTLQAAGEYVYYCRFHVLDQMLGTITVVEGSG